MLTALLVLTIIYWSFDLMTSLLGLLLRICFFLSPLGLLYLLFRPRRYDWR